MFAARLAINIASSVHSLANLVASHGTALAEYKALFDW